MVRALIIGVAIIVTLTATAHAVDPRGLVGYWKFDEGAGSVQDYSGSGNHGSIVQGASVPWVLGFIGSAYLFNGDFSNKIFVPYSKSIDITGQEVTIAAWIKVTRCPDSGVYGEIVKHLQTSTPGGFQIELNGTMNCTIRFNYRDGDDIFTSGQGTRLMPGIWYHVSGGKNSTQIWTTINGAYDLVDASIGTIKSNSQPLVIGSQVGPGSGGTTFDGTIDEVMLYNRALSIGEISSLYEEGLLRHDEIKRPSAPKNLKIIN